MLFSGESRYYVPRYYAAGDGTPDIAATHAFLVAIPRGKKEACMKVRVMLWAVCFLVVAGAAYAGGETEAASMEGEEITLRVMDWSDSTKPYRDAFHEKYMEDHPNITIEYTALTIDQYKNTILTAVRAGEEPDLFPVPVGMRLPPLVQEGWFQPLDPYVTQEFLDKFPSNVYTEGVTMLDGELYALPEWLGVNSSLVYYSKEVFRQSGLDPDSPPESYEEFKEYARKITEAGNGEFYGIIEGGKQLNRWTRIIDDWSSLNGSGLVGGNPASVKTGLPAYNQEAVYQVFQLFQDLANQGSYHPDTLNINAPEARALFAQNVAGFLVQGWWCVGDWNRNNPDFEFGVMAPPLPGGERAGSIPQSTPSPWMGIAARTEHPEEAAELLMATYGEMYQGATVKNGVAYSIVKEINEEHLSVANSLRYLEIFNQLKAAAPDPVVRNPEVASVYANLRDIQPSGASLLQGTVAGVVVDFKAALTELTEKSTAELKRAVEQAQSDGADVQLSDFYFPNWDPMEDYTQADYQELEAQQ
jgi:multiple sugar transport system substrate-binding protein